MALDFLPKDERRRDVRFFGPALPEPYVQFELEKALSKNNLLPDADGLPGEKLREEWDIFRRKIRDISPNSGPVAITNRVLEPLVSRLGYNKLSPAANISTREGEEAGGLLMSADGGAKLRCWAIDYDADLDAPTQRGYAYRFSPVRIAQRVLLTAGERVGIITNGVELRLLLCDPARPDSHIEFSLAVWGTWPRMPDGYQLLLSLASPAGIAALPGIIDDARLKQNKVTKELRVQSRRAVEMFVQAVLDHPDNVAALEQHADKALLAKALWHEGLILVYRLLFVLKCESTSDPSRVFRFASTPLWRNTYSPSTALARIVRRVLDEDVPSGRYLEDGMRVLFKLFAEGLDHPGLTVRPLGGALFGMASTPLLSSLRWGELAVAHLLDRLLWSDTRQGRERVHYGPLDVEDLGRVYEALLELEPGIATEPMCRLRRQKLEVVVPDAQGEKYKATAAPAESAEDPEEDDNAGAAEEADNDKPAKGKKTKVEWIEAIAPGRFYLRVGLGRKSTGSYYTPHSFVRFLVQETLGPQCDERSPRDNPNPGAILKLKVLDPSCGSGHFLVEACRYLAGRVYEAARLCDELATKIEHDAEVEKNAARKQGLLDRAAELRRRLKDLPDEEDELLSYLPSRSAGAQKAVLSAHDIARAEGICRRLVAVHCIYGVDLNPLAVELAKLSLWIESHAEGYPLTFLDHRIIVGNSLTGPFWDKLIMYPCRRDENDQPLHVKGLFAQGLDLQVSRKLSEALVLVKELEASVGVDVQDIERKADLKREVDARLLPFRILAAAWAGGVMIGTEQPDEQPVCDDFGYEQLLKHVGETGQLPAQIDNVNLRAMIAKGLAVQSVGSTVNDILEVLPEARPALPFDLAFPEVFHPSGHPQGRQGFDAVIGNPPWDRVRPLKKEFLAGFNFEVMEATSTTRRRQIEQTLLEDLVVAGAYERYVRDFDEQGAIHDSLFEWQEVEIDGISAGRGNSDLYIVFMERNAQCLGPAAITGVVVPSAFHANEGATGVRRLYLERMALRCCFSFENKNKLFEIHSSFKFATVVAQRGRTTAQFECAFYLHDDQWLFGDRKDRPALNYTLDFVKKTGGDYRSLVEVRQQSEAEIVQTCYFNTVVTRDIFRRESIRLGVECDSNRDSSNFTATSSVVAGSSDPRNPDTLANVLQSGFIFLHEGKTFWHFNDRWEARPAYLLAFEQVARRESWRQNCEFYRIGLRKVASATNERTLVTALLAPPFVAIDSVYIEQSPAKRTNAAALAFVTATSSFIPDFITRQFVASNVNLFIFERIALPSATSAQKMLVHSGLRLTSNHGGYESLWRDQLGDAWREQGKAPFTWPVLTGDDERWAVRATIDALVADAYGLSREQYAHVLSTFSHASYKKAPNLCLAAFDELKIIGRDDFCKKHDPYHDIPLVETLPKPVIDLPIPADGNDDAVRSESKGRKFRLRRQTAATPGLFENAIDVSPSPDAAKILAVRTLLDFQKVVTTADVQERLKFDAAESRAILKHLVDLGETIVEGKGKGTKYRKA